MATTPPLPALKVASADYFHLECNHPQLFHSEYKRSNRTKGLKILRCFPHCCPDHIDRSYCGTSLSVRVQLGIRSPDAAPTDPPPSEILAVFARFEAVNDVSLRPGECVQVDKMAAGTQSDNNLEGQWVAGALDRPSGLVTTIRTPGMPADDRKPLWVLDVDEAVWKSGEKAMKREVVVVGGDIRDGSGAVSLFTLFDIISHVVRVEVAINVQARTLHARSTQGTAGILDCMRLVLDGQERVFSMFPNGMASGIDAGRSGDYIGEMRVDQSGRLVVYLQVFNWSIREDSPSYHLRTRIECWRSRRLCISGDVLATTAPFSFYPREASRLGEMSLRDKRKAVDRSFAEQTQENSNVEWATSAPWKEMGRFRLSYRKA
uniref:Uncharacterized protein n=1 Tax=Phytophthora ramorum TaxID=164328 RepID=H3H9S0_PHYRM